MKTKILKTLKNFLLLNGILFLGCAPFKQQAYEDKEQHNIIWVHSDNKHENTFPKQEKYKEQQETSRSINNIFARIQSSRSKEASKDKEDKDEERFFEMQNRILDLIGFAIQTAAKQSAEKRGSALSLQENNYSANDEGATIKELNTHLKCGAENPNYYFFGVFIYKYKYLPNLSFVKNDISLIKTLATCYIGVPKNHIKILINPSKDEFLGELAAFVEKIRRPDSLLYFYYSGHGITDSFGNFYFLPYAARVDNKVLLKLTSVSLEKVENLLKEANGKKIALVDACRNLATDKGIAIGGFGVKEPNLAIIFSTSQGSVSTADREGKHSAFTKALYKVVSEGLANLDFNNDQYVEIKEIEHSLRRWVKNFSRNPKQEPTVRGNRNLPLFPVNY